LAPQGFHFIKPETLIVTLTTTATTSDLVPFNTDGEDDEFYLYPATLQGRTVRFRLMHFSDPGAGRGDLPTDPGPDSLGARAINEVTKSIENGVKEPSVLAQFLEPCYRQAILSPLQRTANPKTVADAAGEYLVWRAQLAALEQKVPGLEQLFRSQSKNAKSLIVSRGTTFIQGLLETCNQGNLGWDEFVAGFHARDLVALIRQVTSVPTSLEAGLRACLTTRAIFVSTITLPLGDSGVTRIEVRGDFDAPYHEGGHGVTKIDHVDIEVPGCTVTWSQTSDTIEVGMDRSMGDHIQGRDPDCHRNVVPCRCGYFVYAL